MIIKGLFELVFGLLSIVFAPINLPDLPDSIQGIIDQFVDLITSVVGIVGIFIDMDVLKVLIPVVIVIANLDKIWNMIMFILRKIPFLGIK